MIKLITNEKLEEIPGAANKKGTLSVSTGLYLENHTGQNTIDTAIDMSWEVLLKLGLKFKLIHISRI